MERLRYMKTIVLPVVIYACESCSVMLSEEHRLRLFENRVLRRVFGHKRDKVTGESRKMNSVELSILYSSIHIFRQMRWAVHVVSIRKERRK
jgi:hypothetical protein